MATFADAPAGDAESGEKGAGHEQGPNLNGLFGRQSGTSAGYPCRKRRGHRAMVELEGEGRPVTAFLVEPFVSAPVEPDSSSDASEEDEDASEEDEDPYDPDEEEDNELPKRRGRGRGRHGGGRRGRGGAACPSANRVARYYGKVRLSRNGILIPCRPLYVRQFGLKVDEQADAPVNAKPCRPISTMECAPAKIGDPDPPAPAASSAADVDDASPCNQPHSQLGVEYDCRPAPAAHPAYAATDGATAEGGGLLQEVIRDGVHGNEIVRVKRRRCLSGEKLPRPPVTPAAGLGRACVAGRTRSRLLVPLLPPPPIKHPPIFICLDDDDVDDDDDD